MEGHEERAAEAEYEYAELEEQSDSLADDIEAAKEDWDRKKQDGAVPGAGTGDKGDDETDATGEGTPEVEDEDA